MKILCVTYRNWASEIYRMLEEVYQDDHKFLTINSKENYNDALVYNFEPDLILWYGWSWLIPENMVNKYHCLCLHPSPLPLYRGGSPIQNQIISGEKKSAATIFKMDSGVDTGDIIKQLPMSLEGNVEDIFERMTNLGFAMTCDIFENNPQAEVQNHIKATTVKRREEKDSEITLNELQEKPASYIYNKIRMLTSPYPNAYVICGDGRKVYLIGATLDEDV
jgi:methionyl-tRNA formyltransferase